jgi:enoyl-CoA hydratase/3-hydroxyacyl-CoA dehydrogenase
VEALKGLATKLGKEPIVVKDVRGFLANRLMRTLRYHAMILYMKGMYKVVEMDSALIYKFGLPMGIFYLTDFTGGVQLEYDESKSYFQMKRLYPEFEPNPGYEKAFLESLKLMEMMVKEGRTGVRAGKGFYDYPPGKTKPDIPKEAGEGVELVHLISPLVNHAMFMVREGIADRESIDRALKLGFNWKYGVFEYYEQKLTREEVLRSLEYLAMKVPELREFYSPDPSLAT